MAAHAAAQTVDLIAHRQELPLLLTADETAELLRTTRTAVYVMVARGQLPGVTRIGRRVLVRSDALLEWLHQKRAPSPAE
jgi:excisionase family DNA binding protein